MEYASTPLFKSGYLIKVSSAHNPHAERTKRKPNNY